MRTTTAAAIPPILAVVHDIGVVHLTGAVAGLIGLGVVMAVSPTTFGIEIDVLDNPKDNRRDVLVVAAAVAVGATLLWALLLAVSPTTIEALVRNAWSGSVRPWLVRRGVEVVIGVVLVGYGMLRWIRAARPRVPKKVPTGPSRPRRLFALVLANTVVGSSSLTTMVMVVRVVESVPPVFWPVVYAAFLGGVAVPYLLLAAAWTRFPELADDLHRVAARTSRLDLRRPLAVALMAVGLGLVTWSLTHFHA